MNFSTLILHAFSSKLYNTLSGVSCFPSKMAIFRLSSPDFRKTAPENPLTARFNPRILSHVFVCIYSFPRSFRAIDVSFARLSSEYRNRISSGFPASSSASRKVPG